MPEGEADIAYCHACGSPMDVSAVEPFTNVECPNCSKHTRVKREFGPYTLLRRHAIGGMSLVFVALDSTLNREVVLKILSEEYSSDEKRIGAFEEEARITAAISHPHVVRVFTTGRAFGRFYIAMEFVPGGHFEHHIRERGSIPEHEALPLAIEVVEGLQAAHNANLIHRDVKPGNILLDANGHAKIVDFGLALVTKGGKATASEIWATPYYVPPETIEGREEDFRSDVYAFGATFYHALAGKPPCDEGSMDTRRLQQAKLNLTPLTKAASWVSPATGSVMDRCMAYEPAQRFRSYSDLLAAMKSAQQQLAAGPSIPLKTPVQSPTLARRSSSNLGERAALMVSIMLVVAAVVFAVWWVGRDDGDADDNGTANIQDPKVPNVPNPGSKGDGRAGLRVAQLYREAGEAVTRGDFDQARRLFGEVRDHPKAMEPTASWAACESVVACYLSGGSGEGRKEARTALAHIQGARHLNDEVGELLSQGLMDLAHFRTIPVPKPFSGGGANYVVWMLAGLKNWEQGTMESAKPFFEAVAAAPSDGADAWLQPYVKRCQDYLADLKRLEQTEPKSFRLNVQQCRVTIKELGALKSSFRTKGRAIFNVSCWQWELKKRIRTLEGVERKSPPNTEMPGVLAADFAATRFDSALERLKAWKPDAEGMLEKRAALVTLAEAASAFLSNLGERAASEGAEVAIRARDGREFVAISGSGENGLSLRTAEGSEVSLRWGELEVDSLIALHRAMMRKEISKIESMRRHEQAVAFDLLAGDRKRARSAAERLGEDSEAFKRRWEPLLKAMDP